MKMKEELEFERVENEKKQIYIEEKITTLEEKLNRDNSLGKGLCHQIDNIKSKIVVLENKSDSLSGKVNRQNNSTTTSTTTVTTKTQPTTNTTPSPHKESKLHQEKQRSKGKKRKRKK